MINGHLLDLSYPIHLKCIQVIETTLAHTDTQARSSRPCIADTFVPKMNKPVSQRYERQNATVIVSWHAPF